jgi:hypothetical protein
MFGLDYIRNLQDAKITCVKNTDASLLTRFTYATKQVEFFSAANAGNFILPITAMAGTVSLARTTTDPVAKQKVLDTVRDHSDGELLNVLHP